MERGSKRKGSGVTQGFLTKTGVARKEPTKTPADAADIAYAQRVVDDPDTEWVDWGDIKRELADPGD